MMNLNPVEQLLWLMGVAVIFLPLTAACVIACMRAWWQAKDEHIARIANAIGNAMSKAAEEFLKKAEAKKNEQ